MDALSHLIMLNAPQGSIDKNCLLNGDWHLPHAAGELSVVRWHTVTQGAAWLDMPSGDALALHPATVIFLPHNSAHRLRQQGDIDTHIVCGSLRFPTSARYFLTALPEVLMLAPRHNSPPFHWLLSAIALLQDDALSGLPGLSALCSQQCATMMTLALRDWLRHTQQQHLLNLLLHPRLGKVIQTMLASPALPWTVESLAQEVHMSRASFARLFREVSGTTPLAVLAALRLQMAAQSLARERAAVASIAEAAGYASESSFHKAFAREFGCSPGEYRRRVNALAQ
ncbi:MAG: reactive chlorine-specific transcriptional regulator RclR [Yokenella regensburgei]|jgi:AraC-like DNA-binding protein|nr:reactive chlorine-specific transcriptional regulator RclR [Yokenella regensburgei]